MSDTTKTTVSNCHATLPTGRAGQTIAFFASVWARNPLQISYVISITQSDHTFLYMESHVRNWHITYVAPSYRKTLWALWAVWAITFEKKHHFSTPKTKNQMRHLFL